MKSKLYSLILAVSLLLAVKPGNAQVVVVQHGSTASVFSNLDSAIAAASAGDYVYLSGGLFLIHGISTSTYDSLHFYKPLHFVGAGINADSTSVTHETIIQGASNPSDYSGSVHIGSAAGGSTFDGIVFPGQNTILEDDYHTCDSSGTFTFTRCMFNAFWFNAPQSGHQAGAIQVNMHECIITEGVSNAGGGLSSGTFDRCIVMSTPQSVSASVSWTNCVLAGAPGSGSVTNCIIYAGNNSFVNQGGAVYTNCVLGDILPTGGSDVFSNCIGGATMSAVFVNAPAAGFSWANDYHLAAGSPAINYGSDGHDAGVFGGATPTKPGWVPYNPHFTGATIPTSTDGNGNLNINIHVAAQPY